MKSSLTPDRLVRLEQLIFDFVLKRKERTRSRRKRQGVQAYLPIVAKLSDSFTRNRAELRSGYLRKPEGRAAYLLYFHLANVVRMKQVTEELFLRHPPRKRGLRVLDIGSGTGASLWALAMTAEEQGTEELEFEAWDGEGGVLKELAELWSRFHESERLGEIKLRSRKVILGGSRSWRFPNISEPFDLVIVSNLVNELATASLGLKATLLRRMMAKLLSDTGRLVVVEPALAEPSRQLTQLRDLLLAKGERSAPIPCGHAGPCPLNREPKDWCHFGVRWSVPPHRRELERLLRHQSGELKYAYVVFSRQVERERSNQYRVISPPLRAAVGKMVLLCGREGKICLRFNPKQNPRSTALMKCERGDRIEVELEPLAKKPGGPHPYATDMGLARGSQVRIL